MNRLVTWRYELAIIAARFWDENSAWPHLWPSTASDYVETVRTRASESIVFGLKSTEKSTKVVKKQWRICSGRRSRKFAFTARRSGSLLARRRACESSPSANTLSRFRFACWFELLKCGAFECFALICINKFTWFLCAKLSSESCHSDHIECS